MAGGASYKLHRRLDTGCAGSDTAQKGPEFEKQKHSYDKVPFFSLIFLYLIWKKRKEKNKKIKKNKKMAKKKWGIIYLENSTMKGKIRAYAKS